jgi:gp16 family phage-associated protein
MTTPTLESLQEQIDSLRFTVEVELVRFFAFEERTQQQLALLMDATPKTVGNNIKQQLLKQHGMTLAQFSRQYNFKYRDVSECVRGHRHGNYGISRDILEKLQTMTGLTLLGPDQQSR